MTTRDGVRLDADVYRPDAAGSFPVLLMRQPYGRQIASTVVYAHPTWYAAHGFIVVIQDVRGRGTSEGDFQLFHHEVADGYDTVEWAAHLPQSNGQVGMYGFSYQGMTQLLAAQAQPPALKAIAPAMVGYHPHEDWAYEQGALLLQAGLGWAIQLAAETARLKSDLVAFQALYQASRQLPLQEEITACPEVLTQYAPDSFWHDWVNRPQPDDYWHTITPQLAAVDLPMLHIGGWFDPYLRGDVRLYQEMVCRSRFPHPLLIGPWGHIPWGRKVGARDFGPAAESPVDRLQVDWFNQLLNDQDTGILAAAPVTLFEMGRDRWRPFTEWPQTAGQTWQLDSDGLASMRQQSGRLVPMTEPGILADTASSDSPGFGKAGGEAPKATAIDTLVHDPWRPVPSLGGHAAIPSGSFDRSALDCRSDVLTYTSSPLTEPLSVAGHVEVVVCGRCDRPSFDLCCTVSEVMANGSAYILTQGYRRFTTQSNDWATYRLTLQPTCFCIPAGHALRLSISAAGYPAYALNPGTGESAASSRLMDAKVITVAIQSGFGIETYIRLPRVREKRYGDREVFRTITPESGACS
ncbi:MAG: CocE/NonD family hydrolase [Leptolyngbya sp. SIO1E4]|nr:CocE/NonD family hydrolase [Leptolyngbya sp. SIO1E4]